MTGIKRLYHFTARTRRGVEEFINSLPIPVYILGQPEYISENGRQHWVVWYMPLSAIDAQALDIYGAKRDRSTKDTI